MEVLEPPTKPQTESKRPLKPFTILFLLHLLIVSFLITALLIHGFLISPNPDFHPLKFLLPLFASLASSFLSSFSFLLLTRFNPSAALKSSLWSTPLLTLAIGVVLVTAGSPSDLTVGIIAIILAVAFSLYACSVIPHLRHALRILNLCNQFSPPKTVALTFAAVNASAVYSCFLLAGIAGAKSIRGFHIYKAVSITVILISLGWTMQVIKNMVRVTISRAHHLKFLQDIETTDDHIHTLLFDSIEAICVGSLLVPVIGMVRGLARAMEAASGGSDEFMFSCNECYSGLASRMIRHVNRWGFVHVGAYRKGIMQASRDTWELFQRADLLPVIDSDITNSFFFISGVSCGALSSVVGAIWAFVVHRGYTIEVSVFAFLIGYFMARIAMAWPQASVLAYYVAYSENPDCVHFEGTIEVRIHELQRYQA